MIRFLLLAILLCCISALATAQGILRGKVLDQQTLEPLAGASIKYGTGGTVTDADGAWSLEKNKTAARLEVSYVGYASMTYEVSDTVTYLTLLLAPQEMLLQTATVTSGKYERPLGEVTVSMEVLRPRVVDAINATGIDEALDRVPGVNLIEGQANIRGGAGWSYGSGSRVLVLMDDLPALSGDAGTAFWDDLPLENLEQVEVVKGASSALYGSAALNGIINLRTAYAKSQPETKAVVQGTFFGAPANDSAQWWTDRVPYHTSVMAAHRQKWGKLDLTISGMYYQMESFRRDVWQRYGRVTASARYRFTDRFSAGINVNANPGSSRDFFYWKGYPVGAYEATANNYNESQRFRLYLDPWITWFDGKGNRHKLLGRYFRTDNQVSNNQANASDQFYSEYQFQRTWNKNLVLTTGAVHIWTNSSSQLFSDTTFSLQNLALYAQVEYKLWDKLNLSGGIRWEQNRIFAPEFITPATSTKPVAAGNSKEAKPVARVGANYQMAKATYLRASWGQGYRFPTLAEKFTATNAGAVQVRPNPALQSETGWSAELGVRQGFQWKKWMGFLDIAAFTSAYQDMMEFNFNQDLSTFSIFFASQNVGETRIQGIDGSITAMGKLGAVELQVLAGHTWISPRFKDWDLDGKNLNSFEVNQAPIGQQNAWNSSSDDNILKYRFQHSGKIDLEASWKHWKLGTNLIYYSPMKAVDRLLVGILPGVETFRARTLNDNIYVLGARLSYQVGKRWQVGLVVNNALNQAYALRPGWLEAPVSYSLRLTYQSQ